MTDESDIDTMEQNALSNDDEGGEDPAEVVVLQCGSEAHDGPGWYYYYVEYPDEGSVGAFATRDEAVEHATDADCIVAEDE